MLIPKCDIDIPLTLCAYIKCGKKARLLNPSDNCRDEVSLQWTALNIYNGGAVREIFDEPVDEPSDARIVAIFSVLRLHLRDGLYQWRSARRLQLSFSRSNALFKQIGGLPLRRLLPFSLRLFAHGSLARFAASHLILDLPKLFVSDSTVINALIKRARCNLVDSGQDCRSGLGNPVVLPGLLAKAARS